MNHLRFNGDLIHLGRPITDESGLFQGDTRTSVDFDTQNYSDSGHTCQVSQIRMTCSSHAGTHADQPPHFVADPSYKTFPSERYKGEVLVLDLSGRQGVIEAEEIQQALKDQIRQAVGEIIGARLLLRTKRQIPSPDPERYLGFSMKDLLRETQLALLGVDMKTIDRHDDPAIDEGLHGALYETHVAVIENLDLTQVQPGAGEIITIFDPSRRAPDAHGITDVLYAPR